MDSDFILSAWPLILLAAAGLLVISLFAPKTKKEKE